MYGNHWCAALNTLFFATPGNRRLTDENLSTTFCVIEQSLNACWLVSASADALDLEALTLSHFLLGIAGSSLPTSANCDFDHRKRYARAHVHSDAIWSHWFKYYVPSLNRKTKWPSSSDREIQNGNLVWIVAPTSLTGYNLNARVLKLNLGSDAVACSTEIRTASGNLIHPVVKLGTVLFVS